MRTLYKILLSNQVAENIKAKTAGFEDAVQQAISRFSKGDWGKVDAEDAATNEAALENKEQLLGAYDSPCGEIWLISNFYDRESYRRMFREALTAEMIEVTTVLFPSEY